MLLAFLFTLLHTLGGAALTLLAVRRIPLLERLAIGVPVGIALFGLTGLVLLVTEVPPICDGVAVAPRVEFDTAGGAYRRIALAGYLVPAGCLHAAR